MSGWRETAVETGPLERALAWLDDFPAQRFADALDGHEIDWTDVKCVAVQAYLIAKGRKSRIVTVKDLVKIANDLYRVDRAVGLLRSAGVLVPAGLPYKEQGVPTWMLTGKALGPL